MIRPKLCFAALGVVRDVESNAISVFNIFEAIVPSGLPVFMQQAAFFVLWERDQGDPQDVRGRFVLQIGETRLSGADINVNFADKLQHRSIVNLQGVAVPTSGSLRFSIELDGGVRAEYSIDVQAPPAIVQPRHV